MLFVMLFILELRTEMRLMQNSKRWTLHHGFLSKYLYVSLTTSLCASTVGFDKSIIGYVVLQISPRQGNEPCLPCFDKIALRIYTLDHGRATIHQRGNEGFVRNHEFESHAHPWDRGCVDFVSIMAISLTDAHPLFCIYGINMSKNFLPIALTMGVWLIVVYNNARGVVCW